MKYFFFCLCKRIAFLIKKCCIKYIGSVKIINFILFICKALNNIKLI